MNNCKWILIKREELELQLYPRRKQKQFKELNCSILLCLKLTVNRETKLDL